MRQPRIIEPIYTVHDTAAERCNTTVGDVIAHRNQKLHNKIQHLDNYLQDKPIPPNDSAPFDKYKNQG